MMDVSGVGSALAGGTTAKVGKEETIGKDAFLKLLVVQLQNQDPLSPMNSTEFVAQLAQFSSLEGIRNLGVSMDGVAASMASMQNLGTSSLIGRQILAEGNAIEYAGGPVVFGYGLDESAASVTLGIYDATGKVVRQIDRGPASYGDHVVTWDGKDNNGLPVPSGPYTFSVQATNASNEKVRAVPYISGVVSAITMDDGTASLIVGGSVITQDKIKEIF